MNGVRWLRNSKKSSTVKFPSLERRLSRLLLIVLQIHVSLEYIFTM